MNKNGFTQNPADNCVYTKEKCDEKVIEIVWVDDLIIAANSESVLESVMGMLIERFKIKDMGRLKYFLGIDFDGLVKMWSSQNVTGEICNMCKTSLVMKSFEKLIKRELTSRTNCLLDPLQFAYRLNRGVQDATITVLNLILNHLEGNRNHARLLFVDFSAPSAG